MLKKQITLIFCISFNLLLLSQNGDYGNAISKIHYQIRYGADSISNEKADWADYTLSYNENNSVFFSDDTFNFYDIIDKKVMQMKSGGGVNLGTMPKAPRHKTSLLKKGNELFAYMPVGRYMYVYKEPLLKWEILNEKKKIKEFNCILAKTVTDTGNIYYAWFTENIPIPEGPFRFKGLPGLVLEVYNERKTIRISANEIKKSDEKILFINFPKVINLDDKKEKFIKSRDLFIENPAREMANSQIKVFDANTGEELKPKTFKKNENLTTKDLLD